MTARALVLAALTVAAAVVLAVSVWPNGTADTQGSGISRTPGGGVPGQDPAVPPALGLEKMQAERPAPTNRRDLFRFGSAAPASDRGAARGEPPSPPRGSADPGALPAEQPAGPPQPPPIPLRFLGFAETAKGKVAALSDGRFTYYGREGDVIEGRWRIVNVEAETLVIENVDGTGRQTLRLR